MTKTPFAVIECDLGFHITQWNHLAESIFGYAAEEALGRCCLDLIVQHDHREALRSACVRSLAGEAVAPNPVPHRTKMGTILSCEWHPAPVCDKDGTPVGMASLVQDVTERVQVERALHERETLIGGIVASLSAHVGVVNRQGVVISMNGTWARYAQWHRNPLLTAVGIGTNYAEQCRKAAQHHATLEEAAAGFAAVLRGEIDECTVEYAVNEPAGQRWFLMSVNTLGRPSHGAVVSNLDITRRKESDEHVLLAAVFEHIEEGIVILDTAVRIKSLNRAFTAITGFDAKELIGRHPTPIFGFRPNSRTYRAIARSMRKESFWQGEISGERKCGGVFPMWLTVHKVTDDRGRATHYLGIFADITGRKQAEGHLRHLTYRDALTDLPNRTFLSERLRQALAKARRYDRRIAVLLLDLDRFKLINTTLGRDVGDESIRKVGETLERSVRETDTVARMSGDEYIVLLDELTRAADAGRVAQKMLRTLAQPFVVHGHEVFITASIGISVFPDDADSDAELLQHADTAMYRAKETGGNTYQFFAKQMNATSAERLWLENGLRRAINEQQFELRYQPIVNLNTGAVSKVEALLRWCDTTRGWIPPSTFIPVAEETGLIIPLSEWVLHEACRQNGAWRHAGLYPIIATVNFSAHQFRQPNLVDLIQQVLERTDLEPTALEIELTESSLMKNPEAAVSMLKELKRLGIRIAIDDFGTGYSSLSYLRRFPIDVVKIDRSFVADINRNPEDAAITSAIIAMAHNLRLEVVAEGVETEEQLAYLRQLGCDAAQGFYFSQAVQGGQVSGFFTHPEDPPQPD